MSQSLRLMTGLLLVIVAGCASGAYEGPYRGPVPPPVDLSGTWVLNTDLSDDAVGILGDAQARLPGGAGEQMAGGGGRGGGMRGGRGGAGMGGTQDMETMRERMMQTFAMVRQPANRLFIAQTDTSVAITFPAGPGIEVIPDGREVETVVEEGGDIETRAEWSGNELRLSREVDRGGTVRQTFYRSDDGSRLIVITEVQMPRAGRMAAGGMGGRGGRGGMAEEGATGGGGREPARIRRVYDPAGGGS